MLKRISALLLVSACLLIVTSCSNDNKGFREYYHPMGNNPVKVEDWLKKIRNSMEGTEARITKNIHGPKKNFYYVVQSFITDEDGVTVSPLTIYYPNQEVFWETEDSLISDQDEVYVKFIENTLETIVLWSNERKYSVYQ